MKVTQQVWRKYEGIVELEVPEYMIVMEVPESFFGGVRSRIERQLRAEGWQDGQRGQINEGLIRKFNNETRCYEVTFTAIQMVSEEML